MVDALTITDHRTGAQHRLEIQDETIRALQLRPIKVREEDFGLMAYDPGYTNTASCRSAITYIDGERGILSHRGYGIEELAEFSHHEEVAWLLLEGELPTEAELASFRREIAENYQPPGWMVDLFRSFPRESTPMFMIQAALAALGAAFPDSLEVHDPAVRRRHIMRLFGMTPALVALAFRRSRDFAPVEADPSLSYAGNFLRMMLGKPGEAYQPEPALERAMDALLVVHADHEQNCSAAVVRSVGSSEANAYSAVSGGAGALFGPLHGGANQAVLEMLDRIGSTEAIPGFLESCKKGEQRLMGFGHRVYKSYDPRARIIHNLAEKVFEVTGVNPHLAIARELERTALEDDYFISRKLFPNVDFYSGLIYDAMGFETGMFTPFFATGRMIGWLAHWNEMHHDPERRIARPRQIYTGPGPRDYPKAD
ncbi:MAG: citrate (Si)-synthase [Planctomycetota bacterium]|nr:MAG: citrate (Si)-synthase [Planctomycetota bacterium]